MTRPDLIREAMPEDNPSSLPLRLTYDDYCEIPTGHQRYELVGGKIRVVPSPSVIHQEILRRVLMALAGWVEEHDLGKVYPAPLDVVLSEDNVVQPDLLFVSRSRLDIIKEDSIRGTPDLIVEILSPSTSQWDREVKRPLYIRFGVQEVWLVDPESRSVEVVAVKDDSSSSPVVYGLGATLESLVLPGFLLGIDSLFS